MSLRVPGKGPIDFQVLLKTFHSKIAKSSVRFLIFDDIVGSKLKGNSEDQSTYAKDIIDIKKIESMFGKHSDQYRLTRLIIDLEINTGHNFLTPS